MTDTSDTEAASGAQARHSILLDDDLAARLAAFIARNSEFAGREEAALRHVVRLWLTEHGYDGTHADAGTPPQRLNASNDD